MQGAKAPGAKNHRVTLIEGDGIGPELVRAAVRVLAAAGVGVEWESVLVGEGVSLMETMVGGCAWLSDAPSPLWF